MDFGALFSILKSVAPLVAFAASTAAAIAHGIIIAQHKKDHALLVDQIAQYAGKVSAYVNPAPQQAVPDAASTP